jgi:predicted dehydrogenase
METRLKVGVVGAGIIAQVMHLNYLRELSDKFEVVALCDIAAENSKNSAAAFGIARTFTDWRELLKEPIDVVFILTSGTHAPIAIAAAEAGKHVLVEKPMCFSVEEGKAMDKAAKESGVTLMVAYPKRYDPAFIRFQEEIESVRDPRLFRVTTFESPFLPYVRHYSLAPVTTPSTDAATKWRVETDKSITKAIGTQNEFLRKTYHLVLLDTLVHEINTVRASLGEPDVLEYVDINESSMNVFFRFNGVPVIISWMDLPGITKYGMEFAYFGPEKRVTLTFPSPFLRSAPTMLDIEGGEVGTPRSWKTEEVTSYESAFKQELIELYGCIVEKRKPRTTATDAIHDLAICQNIIKSFQTKSPIQNPSHFD